MGQCEWLKPLELAAQIPVVFFLCLALESEWLLVSSPSDSFVSICPGRVLLTKKPAASSCAWGKQHFPTSSNSHHDLPLTMTSLSHHDCQLCAWGQSCTGWLGQLGFISCHVVPGRGAFSPQSTALCYSNKTLLFVGRCDPNCHFWRFCKLQVPKVKPSRWKRWAQFVGADAVPVPVPGCVGHGSSVHFPVLWNSVCKNRNTLPIGLQWFDWSQIVLRAPGGIGIGVWNIKEKFFFLENQEPL